MTGPGKAAATVRRDLLDTYDSRLRTALAGLRDADEQGFTATRAEMGALALGYWQIVAPAYRAQHGAAAERRRDARPRALGGCVGSWKRPRVAAPLSRVEHALAGFRAAPLSDEEIVRRAGQLDRFLRLVPIEYGRGVKDGRVTLEFEIQEAVTFRDGAAAAFHDLEPSLAARPTPPPPRRLGAGLDELGSRARGRIARHAVAAPARSRRRPRPRSR